MITFLDVAPTPLQLVALLLAAIGLLVFLPRTIGDLILRRRGIRTTGKVVRLHPDNQGGASVPTIDFVDAGGRTRRFRSDLPANSDRHFIGAEIAIVYDPRKPSRAREAGRSLAKLLPSLLAYLLIGFALLFGLLHPLAAGLTSL